MKIPFIYLYSRWNAYPEIINNLFDETKIPCKQLARVLAMSTQKVHQWLLARKIKSVVRFFGGFGGIAFYDKNAIQSYLSEKQQKEMQFITMSELASVTGINMDRLRKFLLTNKNIPTIMTKPRTGKNIAAYDKEFVFNILKEGW